MHVQHSPQNVFQIWVRKKENKVKNKTKQAKLTLEIKCQADARSNIPVYFITK